MCSFQFINFSCLFLCLWQLRSFWRRPDSGWLQWSHCFASGLCRRPHRDCETPGESVQSSSECARQVHYLHDFPLVSNLSGNQIIGGSFRVTLEVAFGFLPQIVGTFAHTLINWHNDVTNGHERARATYYVKRSQHLFSFRGFTFYLLFLLRPSLILAEKYLD